MQCPRCHKQTADDSEYCAVCGHSFGAPAPPASPASPGAKVVHVPGARPASSRWLLWVILILGSPFVCMMAATLPAGLRADQAVSNYVSDARQATAPTSTALVRTTPIAVSDAPASRTATPRPVLPIQTPTLTRAELEAQILAVLEAFQAAKSYAQSTGDTSRLPEILAGNALEYQISLVEQTQAANCYWDIQLEGPMSIVNLELRSPSHVKVRASKTESRHKYCDGSSVATVSADHDTYEASYELDIINGRWMITWRE